MSQSTLNPRLLPDVINEYTWNDPNYIVARVPKTADFADGLKDITISTFSKAVDEVAHRIESRIGRSSSFDTIAYIGPSQSIQYS